MTKICICDLDGVIADNSERAKVARDATSIYKGRTYWDHYYAVLFDPDLVKLDTVVPGAVEAIYDLLEMGYILIYLSSRPHTMWEATKEWLIGHNLFSPAYEIILKDYGDGEKDHGDRYIKTTQWKWDKVSQIIRTYTRPEADLESVLFIDDSVECREKIATMQLRQAHIMIKYSLQDALETDKQLHPQHSANASELLMCVESIANAACVRERLEHDDPFELRVQLLGNDMKPGGMPLVIKAWGGGATRRIQILEMFPRKDSQEVPGLAILMDGTGKTLDIVLASDPDEMLHPNTFEHPFAGDLEEHEKLEGYANWKAYNLREMLYVEAARYARDKMIIDEMKAFKAYMVHVQAFKEMIRKALRGGHTDAT